MLERLVVITLDSCRYDSAVAANPTYLNTISALNKAIAHATFTLPAHVALFHGYFPQFADSNSPPKLLGQLPAIRSESNSYRRGTAAGTTWVNSLKLAGWTTIGAAGMRWFESPMLRADFDHFCYRGPSRSIEDEGIPVWNPEEYALNHPDEIASIASKSNKWLIFVNSAETHCPYGITDQKEIAELRRLAGARNAKMPLPDCAETRALMKTLHGRQIKAVREVDKRIESLFSRLERPFGFIVTADHGESFGENGLWGHVHNAQSVAEVPMWEGTVN